MKAFRDKLIWLAAIVLSVLYTLEVLANDEVTQINLAGIGIAALIIVVWLISVGVFFSRTSRSMEAKKAEKARKAEEKSASADSSAEQSDAQSSQEENITNGEKEQ